MQHIQIPIICDEENKRPPFLIFSMFEDPIEMSDYFVPISKVASEVQERQTLLNYEVQKETKAVEMVSL